MNDFDSICDPTTGGAAAGAWDAVAALGGGKAVAPSAPQRIDPETMDALLRGVSGITHPGHPPVQDDAGGTAQFRTDVRALNFNLTEASDKYDAALAAAAALRGDPPPVT